MYIYIYIIQLFIFIYIYYIIYNYIQLYTCIYIYKYMCVWWNVAVSENCVYHQIDTWTKQMMKNQSTLDKFGGRLSSAKPISPRSSSVPELGQFLPWRCYCHCLRSHSWALSRQASVAIGLPRREGGRPGVKCARKGEKYHQPRQNPSENGWKWNISCKIIWPSRGCEMEWPSERWGNGESKYLGEATQCYALTGEETHFTLWTLYKL